MTKGLADNINEDTFQDRRPEALSLLVNDTSKTEIKDSQLIEIIGLGESSCILKIPKKICAQGHALTIYFLLPGAPLSIKRFPTDGEIEHTIRVLSKVTKIEESGEDEAIIECQFNQFSKGQWLSYLETFQGVQKKIFEEFSKIKGE